MNSAGKTLPGNIIFLQTDIDRVFWGENEKIFFCKSHF